MIFLRQRGSSWTLREMRNQCYWGGMGLLANHKPTLILEIESFLSFSELSSLLKMLNLLEYQGFAINNCEPILLVAVVSPRDVIDQPTTNFLFTCDGSLLKALAPYMR